ncbi:MAG TPA: hypothetical protein EYP34_01785 [Chromatiaceae bacterium]|nr:hypothetical protein [Chromatiaceae bacterium]
MNTAYLLVMLTFNAAGQGELSFVATESQQQCQIKGQVVAGILSSAGIETREKRCIQTSMQFSPFKHTEQGSKQPAYQYRARFTADAVEITPVTDLHSCRKTSKHKNNAQERIYCAASSQKMLSR